jgi:hypothetical protein
MPRAGHVLKPGLEPTCVAANGCSVFIWQLGAKHSYKHCFLASWKERRSLSQNSVPSSAVLTAPPPGCLTSTTVAPNARPRGRQQFDVSAACLHVLPQFFFFCYRQDFCNAYNLNGLVQTTLIRERSSNSFSPSS